MKIKLHVSYFALLREQRGLAAEEIETTARSPRELYTELAQQYKFSLPVNRLRIAIGGDFSSWDAPLNEGTKLAFIPPVAGG